MSGPQKNQQPEDGRAKNLGCLIPLCFLLVASICMFLVPLLRFFKDGTEQAPSLAQDILNTFNAGLILVASLAALSFTYAQAIPDRPDARRLAVTAGEWHTLGALALLFGSVFRYAYLADPKEWKGDSVRILPLFLLVGGVVASHIGLGFLINSILTRWSEQADEQKRA